MDNFQESIPLNEMKTFRPTPSTSTAENHEMNNCLEIIPMNEMTLNFRRMLTTNAVDDEADENCATLKKYLRKYMPFERQAFLMNLCRLAMHIIDLIFDILVTKDFYERGEVVLTILSSVFIGLPYLCNIILSLLEFMIISWETPRTKKPWCALISLHIPPIVPFLW
ncbi:unnamed protein product [Dibothriocephalus latus]|uniref:XK-related protein n=1 Tax=Dibothriocephalus latus TaxID=60516 RepID=A0A3P7P5T4_DIBLA|nr:unnamed protein product [Dibothriocephalus latus]